MNIFATSDDPRACAVALDDKRLVKMVLETAQLLCTALRYKGDDNPTLYKSTHVNHPCSVWLRDNSANFDWLVRHFWELCAEYTYRFNKIHACESKFAEIFSRTWTTATPREFVNCTPHKDLPVFEAYRKTMIEKWENDKVSGRLNRFPRPGKRLPEARPKWTNRFRPDWG